MMRNKCPVCDSGKITLFMEGIFDSEITNVLECGGCGLQFLSPMMSDPEEESYYRDYYENQRKRHYKGMSMKDLQQNALNHYNQYKGVYSDLLKDKKEILELGSGSGGFLKFIKENSPESKITSVERSISNREFLQDRALNGDLGDIPVLEDFSRLSPGEEFDLVAAFGVFEHIKNGAAFLDVVRGCLADNGRLAINIPNKRNPLIDIYGVEEFKKFTYMKQHYYTYTEESLEILAKKTGYCIEKINYIQVWGLDNHLSWLKNKRPMDFSLYTKMLSKNTIDSYNNDLIEKKITDLMMVVMKKNQKGSV